MRLRVVTTLLAHSRQTSCQLLSKVLNERTRQRRLFEIKAKSGPFLSCLRQEKSIEATKTKSAARLGCYRSENSLETAFGFTWVWSLKLFFRHGRSFKTATSTLFSSIGSGWICSSTSISSTSSYVQTSRSSILWLSNAAGIVSFEYYVCTYLYMSLKQIGMIKNYVVKSWIWCF